MESEPNAPGSVIAPKDLNNQLWLTAHWNLCRRIQVLSPCRGGRRLIGAERSGMLGFQRNFDESPPTVLSYRRGETLLVV
jgi:hypothetical protein